MNMIHEMMWWRNKWPPPPPTQLCGDLPCTGDDCGVPKGWEERTLFYSKDYRLHRESDDYGVPKGWEESTCHFEPKVSPMHEDEETMPMEEEQEQEMEEGDDDPHLDLERDQEVQAYNHVMDHEFVHMPAYDPNLLEKIGMDTEFTIKLKVVGWENVALIDKQGSRILTI
jgi:hypothetical protein